MICLHFPGLYSYKNKKRQTAGVMPLFGTRFPQGTLRPTRKALIGGVVLVGRRQGMEISRLNWTKSIVGLGRQPLQQKKVGKDRVEVIADVC